MEDDNSLLSGLSIDFALLRLKPPPEFVGVGAALTEYRRQAAEEGTHHRTARRLGALFSDIVPNIHLLVRAFGNRATEIIESSRANRRGTVEDGPFKEYVGVDATAIWASATSGVASIAVLLLACMLARKFDDHRSTVALWIEMVKTRQSELLARAEANGSISDAVLAKQHILREDLAAFDSRVRAWLATADFVMNTQHRRLNSILDNTASNLVSTGDSTYTKVLKAWRDAMGGFEALLGGVPQSVSEASLLLALSAWHIYPDLILLSDGPRKIEFQDRLVSQSAIITVGLRLSNSVGERSGFHWSLTLSHLRYYGEAVEVDTKSNNIKISLQELQVIVFGALVKAWGIPHIDTSLTAACIQEIAKLLKELPKKLPKALPADIRHVLSGLTDNWFPWYDGVLSSSKSFSALFKIDPKRCDKLLQYGRRRYMNFFEAVSKRLDSALFGLSNPHILRAISLPPGLERDLSYCRSLLPDVRQDRAVIVAYRYFIGKSSTEPITVLASTRPLGFVSKLNDRKFRTWVERHCRWVIVDQGNWNTEIRSKTNDEIKSLLDLPDGEDVEVLTSNQENNDGSQTLDFSKDGSYIVWHHAPESYRYAQGLSPCGANEDLDGSCSCFDALVQNWAGLPNPPQLHYAAAFERVCGDENGISIFCSRHYSPSTSAPPGSGSQLVEHVRAESARTLSMRATLEHLRERPPDSLSLTLYFSLLTQCKFGGQADIAKLFSIPPEDEVPYFASNPEGGRRVSNSVPKGSGHSKMHDSKAWAWNRRLMRLDMGQGGLWWNHWRLWSTMDLISTIFEEMPGSSFPLKIVDQQFPLIANHRTQHVKRTDQPSRSLSQIFACIAMMEVGGAPFDPKLFERAFALCIDNSIYVSELMLGDPLANNSTCGIRRIPGNLDRPGMSILLCPQDLHTQEKTDFEAVNHFVHDGERSNRFHDISLHLSLLDRRVPVYHGLTGLIDQDIFLIESVVSVHNGGNWYADIDVLNALPLPDSPLKIVKGSCSCGANKPESAHAEFVSIDNFDELLDPPTETPGIVRSHKNWAARLAAVCIVRQRFGRERATVIASEDEPCYKCLAEMLKGTNRSDPGRPSRRNDLPQIVID